MVIPESSLFKIGQDLARSDRERVVAVERELTVEAARRVGADPEPLYVFAEQRANKGPIRDFDSRDFEREVREELADARSYIIWGIQQAQERGEDTERLFGVLARVASAYSVLTRKD